MPQTIQLDMNFPDVCRMRKSANELMHSPELRELRQSKYQTQEGGFDVCLGIQEEWLAERPAVIR